MVRGPGFASLRVHFLTTAATVDLNTGRVKESVVCHLQHNKNGKTARQKRQITLHNYGGLKTCLTD